MFEDSLVESAALLRARNRWPALVSFATQCTLAMLVLSLPMFHPELMPLPGRIPISLAPPHFSPPPLPPVVMPRSLTRSSSLATPMEAVATVERTPDCACPNPSLNGSAVDGPALGAINLAGNNSALPLGTGALAPSSPHVSVGPPAGKATAPVLISSGVSAGLLLAPIRPEYPEIARVTRTEGTVVIDATISPTGNIERAHVLSGPTMLQAAALAAVRQARYRPFMLNGKPTEVQTTITINFRIGG